MLHLLPHIISIFSFTAMDSEDVLASPTPTTTTHLGNVTRLYDVFTRFYYLVLIYYWHCAFEVEFIKSCVGNFRNVFNEIYTFLTDTIPPSKDKMQKEKENKGLFSLFRRSKKKPEQVCSLSIHVQSPTFLSSVICKSILADLGGFERVCVGEAGYIVTVMGLASFLFVYGREQAPDQDLIGCLFAL